MKGFKGFYKDNRVYVILMIVSIVCIILVISGVLIYFVGQSTKDAYGNRLEGIEKVKIKEDKLTELETTIKENELVEKVNTNVSGKILYIVVHLTKGVPTDAENIAVKALEKLSDEEKAFYDIQFIFDSSNEGEDNVFPIMGYKNAKNTTISWTKYSS